MIVVIFARTLDNADEAAFNLGLRDDAWMHPREVRPHHVIDRVVYVDGWRASATITLGQAALVNDRRTLVSTEEETLTSELWLTADDAAQGAQAALAAQRHSRRVQQALVAPFVDPGAVYALYVDHQPGHRSSWWQRLKRKVRQWLNWT